jgi:methyl halide transferase
VKPPWMSSAGTDWEARYRAGDAHWDRGEAAPGLVDFLAAHPEVVPATVLVPGCGTGHDVRALAAAGFRATGLDVAPTAIALGRERNQGAGLEACLTCGNFLTDEPAPPFDWLFEHTLFCALDPVQRDDYVRAVRRWLRPGGDFLAIHYLNPEHPDGPPFPVSRDELMARFAPEFDLIGEWIPRSYPNRTGRELTLWWRARGGA